MEHPASISSFNTKQRPEMEPMTGTLKLKVNLFLVELVIIKCEMLQHVKA